MDTRHFDGIVRSLNTAGTRRSALMALAAGGLSLGFIRKVGGEAGITGILLAQNLDRDLVLEEGIGSQEGLGEAPLAEAAGEPIAAGQKIWQGDRHGNCPRWWRGESDRHGKRAPANLFYANGAAKRNN